MGTAVLRAAEDAKKQLLQCAGKILKQKPNTLSLRDGHVVTQSGDKLSYSKVIVDFFGSKAGEIIGKGLYKDKRSTKAVLGSTTTFWEVGWGAVEVEVDPDTGIVKSTTFAPFAWAIATNVKRFRLNKRSPCSRS